MKNEHEKERGKNRALDLSSRWGRRNCEEKSVIKRKKERKKSKEREDRRDEAEKQP